MRCTRFARLSSVVALLVAVGVGPAWGQASEAAQTSGEVRALLERIERLEGEMRTLNRFVYRAENLPEGQAPAAAAPAGAPLASGEVGMLFDRVVAMEAEVRRLTGALEVADHRIDQVDERVDRLVGDVDFRLRELETAAQAGAGAAAPAAESTAAGAAPGALGTVTPDQLAAVGAPAGAAAQILPEGTPDEQYQYSLRLLRAGDYRQAETAFDAFLTSHDGHALTSNAHYWKGEAVYARKDYERAARIFVEGYQAVPEGSKAPDMLLKLGMSLAALGEGEQACATFDQLTAQFPNASAAVQRRTDRERARAACPGG